MANEIDIAVRASTAVAERGLDRFDHRVEESGAAAQRHGAASSALGKGIGLGLAGIAGGLGLMLKTGIDEAKDASAGQAQLEAGLKSTNSVAGTTVQGMEDLASSVQNYSGQTDDSIVKSEQLLLTFTNIRNKGPDKIFDLATKASADMAAKMGGDASSNAILLGKALNDPVKGITALTKVGVSFTQGQKDQIAAMVKTGNVAGAQKVILKELNTEFGGAAKAAGESVPGQMARARRSFEDTSQTLVTALLPAFTMLMHIITGYVLPAITMLTNYFTGGSTSAKLVGIAIGALVAVLLVAKIATTAQAIATNIWTAATKTAAIASKAWAAAQWLLNAAMDANPIGLVVIAIVALIAILVIAWKHSETFRAVVTGAFNAVKGAASAVVTWIRSNWPLLLAILTGPVGLAVLIIARHWGTIKNDVSGVINWVTSKFGSLISFFRGLPGRITSAVGDMFGGIRNAFRNAINDVIDIWNRLHFHVPHIPGTSIGGDITVPQIGHMATGGIGGGLTEVGEHGRELLNLPQGSRVRSNPDTEQAYASGGKREPIVLELHSSGSDMDNFLIQLLRKAIRVRGGNVQLVLGPAG